MLISRLKVTGIIAGISIGLPVKDAILLIVGWFEMFFSLISSFGFLVKTDAAQAAGGALLKDVFLLIPRLLFSFGILFGLGGKFIFQMVPEAFQYVQPFLNDAKLVR